jgi:hypothetical protein
MHLFLAACNAAAATASCAIAYAADANDTPHSANCAALLPLLHQ